MKAYNLFGRIRKATVTKWFTETRNATTY